jgi:plastocyanin
VNHKHWSRLGAMSLAAAMTVAACAGNTPSAVPSVGSTSAAPATTAPASLQSSPSPTVPVLTPTPAAPSPEATNKVTIVDFAFKPGAVIVKAGTSVTWTNQGRPHTVTADDGSFDSGRIAAGATFSMTFKKAGTYAYHCAIHPSMVAQVVVTP